MKQSKLTAEQINEQSMVAQALAKEPKKTAFQVYTGMAKVAPNSGESIPFNDLDDDEDDEYYSSQLQKERATTAEELKEIRVINRLTQANIAQGIGSSITTICNFEKGRYLTRWDMIAKAYKMLLDSKGIAGTLKEIHNAKGQPQTAKPVQTFEQTMTDADISYEKIVAMKEKNKRMVQFIQDQNLIEQYNLTVMNSNDDFKALSIPVGQYEINTMKDLVKQYDEVKYRLTAIYEMGDNETGPQLQKLYDETRLEY